MKPKIDWDKVKFRASSWGNLLSEPQSKAAKDAGELSATCKKELIKIYALLKYGRKKDIVQKQMTKGILAEPQSIMLFSRVKETIFQKNEEQLENDWFTGHPDIIHETGVWDIKTSWELDSFLPKLEEKPDPAYVAQLQCYYSLTGAQGGGIVYCLADCPESVLMDEKRRLLYSMDVVSDESPEYKAMEAELVRNLTYPDIPYHEKVIIQPVPKDEDLIQKMKDKVPKLREWLAEFDEKHSTINK